MSVEPDVGLDASGSAAAGTPDEHTSSATTHSPALGVNSADTDVSAKSAAVDKPEGDPAGLDDTQSSQASLGRISTTTA